MTREARVTAMLAAWAEAEARAQDARVAAEALAADARAVWEAALAEAVEAARATLNPEATS